MNLDELEALEQLAKAATPGPWRYRKDPMIKEDWQITNGMVTCVIATTEPWAPDFDHETKANAQWIAAANPTAILALIARVKEAENLNVLLRAEADGIGSMLLDVQQDCITAHQAKEAAEESERAMSFEYFEAIARALLDGAADECFRAYGEDVADLRAGKKTWTAQQTAHVIDRMIAVMIGLNARLDVLQTEARRSGFSAAKEEAVKVMRRLPADEQTRRAMGARPLDNTPFKAYLQCKDEAAAAIRALEADQ